MPRNEKYFQDPIDNWLSIMTTQVMHQHHETQLHESLKYETERFETSTGCYSLAKIDNTYSPENPKLFHVRINFLSRARSLTHIIEPTNL